MGDRRHLLAAVVGITVWALSAGVAQADVIHVHPGQSIQHAVNMAHPGDVVKLAPGTYFQNVTIQKNGITLMGSGTGPNGSRLVSGGRVVPGVCNSPEEINGICIVGRFDPTTGAALAPVRRTTVRDLSLHGWTGFGIHLFNANRSTIDHVLAADNGGYGISGFVLHGLKWTHNVALRNGFPGFYIGDSPNASAVVAWNRASGNGTSGVEGIGFLIRDSSWGKLWGNTATGNCAGFLFLDSGENPIPAAHWWAAHNVANRNNLVCEAEPGGAPPFSGVGIALFGARHSVLWQNTTNGNHPNGPSVFSGGIVVASSVAGGGRTPVGNLIKENHAHNNSPFDILYDGSGFNNRFVDNDCGTSSPAFICS
jgi:parallel beta helix pectate lyase-like protein